MQRTVSGKYYNGFTLLELTIVLTIIALIAGSILAGRSMIRSAELQAVIKEYDVYVKATQEFNEKYGQLPGDFSTATTIWGSVGGGCAVYITPPGGYATCNGDGNGRIGTSTSAGVLGSSSEWWLVWAHLANAGLIDGRYTGGLSSTSTVGEAQIGTNVPGSQFSSGGWTMFYMQQVADSANLHGEPTGGYGHMLSFGKAATGTYTRGAVMSPTDARDIDNKMDDGIAGTGSVRGWKQGYQPTCTTNDGLKTTHEYKTAISGVLQTDAVCSLLFILGF